jgi:hypothetical protein
MLCNPDDPRAEKAREEFLREWFLQEEEEFKELFAAFGCAIGEQ